MAAIGKLATVVTSAIARRKFALFIVIPNLIVIRVLKLAGKSAENVKMEIFVLKGRERRNNLEPLQHFLKPQMGFELSVKQVIELLGLTDI